MRHTKYNGIQTELDETKSDVSRRSTLTLNTELDSDPVQLGLQPKSWKESELGGF